MYTVNNFCFCCDLRTSSVTLGCLTSVWAAFKLVAYYVFGQDDTVNENLVSDNVYQNVFILVLIMSSITFITSILLLVGTIKKIAVLLIPYMISCVLVVISEILMNIFEWVSIESEPTQSGWLQALDIFTSMLFIALELYLLLCIYSLYRLIQNTISNPSVVMTQRSDIVN